jgi:hypothetical protein
MGRYRKAAPWRACLSKQVYAPLGTPFAARGAAPPGAFFGLGFVTGGLIIGRAALWFDRLRYVRR